MKEIKFHPYKMQMRYGLSPTDPLRRVAYSEWFVQDNTKLILIGDEVKFPINGKVNSQNVREYAEIRHPPLDFNADIRTDVSVHFIVGVV
jgi:hypothetical protein